jgi:hypothetical protein
MPRFHALLCAAYRWLRTRQAPPIQKAFSYTCTDCHYRASAHGRQLFLILNEFAAASPSATDRLRRSVLPD